MFFPNTVSVPTKSSKDDAAEGQFAPGDNVEVIEGELINLQGKIVSVEGSKIVMLPFHEDLKVSLKKYTMLINTDDSIVNNGEDF
jgi:transcription antitermination factor NusG